MNLCILLWLFSGCKSPRLDVLVNAHALDYWQEADCGSRRRRLLQGYAGLEAHSTDSRT